MTPRPQNVGILIPSHDQVPMAFAVDLARLYRFEAERRCSLYPMIGTYVHTARQRLAEQAMKDRLTHVLWIDADMRFPCDALRRLLLHDLDIVGIDYRQRHPPHGFIAVRDGVRVSSDSSAGLEQVHGIGFGLVLMRAEVLYRTHSNIGSPLFHYEWTGTGWVGEDFYFCAKAQQAGFDVYVDHELSRECAHIGTMEYQTAEPSPYALVTS